VILTSILSLLKCTPLELKEETILPSLPESNGVNTRTPEPSSFQVSLLEASMPPVKLNSKNTESTFKDTSNGLKPSPAQEETHLLEEIHQQLDHLEVVLLDNVNPNGDTAVLAVNIVVKVVKPVLVTELQKLHQKLLLLPTDVLKLACANPNGDIVDLDLLIATTKELKVKKKKTLVCLLESLVPSSFVPSLEECWLLDLLSSLVNKSSLTKSLQMNDFKLFFFL